MVIYNIFTKLDKPIVVSEKLQIYLLNPAKRDPFYTRIKRLLKKDLNMTKKHYRKWEHKEFSINKILMSNYWDGMFDINLDSTEDECITELMKYIVIMAQVKEADIISNKVNEKRYHVEQINEYSICHKISLLKDWLPTFAGVYSPQIIYDDERDMCGNNYWMFYELEAKIFDDKYLLKKRFKNNKEDIQISLEEFIKFQFYFDSYIESESDFYKLDFIMDHLFEQTSHYQRFLSPFFIIEMLLVNPKKSIREQLKQKLKYIPIEHYRTMNYTDVELWATSVYDIRSKLVHGDFKNFEKEIRKHKNKFLASFDFDYFEFTEIHWVLDIISGALNEVAQILVLYLIKSKEEVYKFRNDDITSILFNLSINH